MKRCLSRTLLLSTALGAACAMPGLRAHAQQAGQGLTQQLPRDAAEAVRQALGLGGTPAPSVPRPAAAMATAAPTDMRSAEPASKEERQVRNIMGFSQEPTVAFSSAGLASAPEKAQRQPPGSEPVAQVSAPGPATVSPTAQPPVLSDAAAAPSRQAALAATPTVPAPIDAARAPAAPAGFRTGAQVVAALDESTLDTMRGGFIGDGGLKISFGIERAVYVNGNLVTTTSLNLSELGALSAGKGASLDLADAGTRIALIQSGAGNTVLNNLGPAAIGTVIQNTLNGQKIQTMTVINATANSLSVLKSLDLERNVRGAITDALRR
ncbi:hypothetical protein [Azohydromonas caseinilytica]|uniref:Uncharacterized protein n=1 Tax=Azohydromonas caseinilytica TaxID=2728836 RepID=A0A848FFL7_9BURK|nr:hypothetical protein [Azohydromonas caseinilytica]NML17635.1 hypothetical protein [Azohydromonas caseinilytica]